MGSEKTPPGVIDVIGVDADKDNLRRVSVITGVLNDNLIGLSKGYLTQMLIKKGKYIRKVGEGGSATTCIDKSRCEASDEEESLSSSDNSDSVSSLSDGARSGIIAAVSG